MSIFKKQISRFPQSYTWTKTFIDTMWKGHWTPNEFNFHSDIQDYKVTLSAQEQQIVSRTLTVISQIEVAVKTFWTNLGHNLPHPNILDMGIVMANIEVIHNIAYEKLLTVLGLQAKFEQIFEVDTIKNRVKYLTKYNEKVYKDKKKQYLYSLILFTLFTENVSLFSQFYIILWFGRYKNVLKDTNQQVQYTKNEELIHGLIGSRLINTIREESPELFDDELINRIQEETKVAFDSECRIVEWLLGDYKQDNISKEIIIEYVKYRINISLQSIKLKQPFKIDNSLLNKFYWVEEEILGNNSTDFFYKKPTDYVKKDVSPSDLF